MNYITAYIIKKHRIYVAVMFIKAYNNASGTYEQKMVVGHKATWYLYQFIVFTRPLFMQNPILNVSKILLWSKTIFLNVVLYVTLLGGTSLCMLCYWRMFKIRLFQTEKEYREYAKKFNNLKKY